MKTVYILGVGFSMDAGAPSQANILKDAFKLHQETPGIFKERIVVLQDFLTEQLNTIIGHI